MDAFSQFGKYQILERIAYGGMAELFRARLRGDQGFQKLVAIKKMHDHFAIDPDVVEAFIEEAKLAAFLQHPNIVQIYDFGSLADAYFIVMEYLQGKDLRSVTRALEARQRLLGIDHGLFVAASICAGLAYAHRLTDMAGRPLHLVHRDISPQNIFVTYDGQVKILDFGIAKATDRSAATEAGVLKGKVAYMSPEQARGRAIDHRADQFAVGIVLYELLSGRRLYRGNAMEILRLAQSGDFPPPKEMLPDLAPNVRHVLERLLAVDPEERFSDCGAAAAALEECLGDLSFRSIGRHLADLVSDLFAAEKVVEESRLQQLVAGDPAPLPVASPADGDRADPSTGKVAAPLGGDPAGREAPPGRRSRRWLIAGLCGLLAALLVFLWLPWHIPVTGPSNPLEAFEARRYGSADPTEAGDASPVPPSARYPTSLSPRERQAQSMMSTDPLQARDLWAQVADEDPDNLRAHFHLGLLNLELQAYPQAIAAFEDVLALAPEMIDARFNLGYAYAKVEQYDKAEALYQQVADQVPEYLDEVLFNLAIVQDERGDRPEAVRSLQAAIRFNPHNVRAISYLARMEGRFSTPP